MAFTKEFTAIVLLAKEDTFVLYLTKSVCFGE